jgi:hypothetical protein
MPVELIPVVAAGLAGGLAMYAIQLAATAVRPADVFDVGALWALLLNLRGPSAQLTGLAVHFLVSVGIAGGYALGFAAGGVTDNGWAWGLIGGVIHWIGAGTFTALVPRAEGVPAGSRGGFGGQLGAGPLGFLMAHLLFGLVVGIVYFATHTGGGVGAVL